MWTSLRRLGAFLFITLLLTATASADDGFAARGPVYDITHFDVIPVNLGTPDSFEQTAYAALFAYRDASVSDAGSKSFRVHLHRVGGARKRIVGRRHGADHGRN